MNKKAFAPIIAVLIIAGFAALGSGYVFYKNPSGILGKIKNVLSLGGAESPEAALALALENMSKARSFSFSGQSSGGAAMVPQISGSAVGAQVPSQVALTFEGFVDIAMMSFGGNAAIDIKGANSYRIDIEIRKIADVAYFRFGELPKPFDYLTGKWVKADIKNLGEQYGQEKTAEKIKELNRDKIREILNKAKERNIVKVAEEFQEEEINALTVRHFRIAWDKPALETFIKEISEDPFDANEEAKLREFIARLDFYTTDVWVGKYDSMLYKFSVNYAPKTQSVKTGPATMLSVVFGDFNKKVVIEAPAGARSLEEILQEALQKLFPGANVQIGR